MEKIVINKIIKDVKLSDVYRIYDYIIDGFISEVMERKQKIEIAMSNTAKLKITYLMSNQTINIDYDFDERLEDFYTKLEDEFTRKMYENNFNWSDPMDKKSHIILINDLNEKLQTKKEKILKEIAIIMGWRNLLKN